MSSGESSSESETFEVRPLPPDYIGSLSSSESDDDFDRNSSTSEPNRSQPFTNCSHLHMVSKNKFY